MYITNNIIFKNKIMIIVSTLMNIIEIYLKKSSIIM